jgi:threonine 3-dehydrogenase
MGATLAIDPRERSLESVFAELDMVEGFDVVLEMSGNPNALQSAIGSMAHGGGIAILGIPTEEISLDVNAIVFKMLTVRGIYGREMYETWYKITVMLQSGLDITPAITHRFSFREHEAAFAAARSGLGTRRDRCLQCSASAPASSLSRLKRSETCAIA